MTVRCIVSYYTLLPCLLCIGSELLDMDIAYALFEILIE